MTSMCNTLSFEGLILDSEWHHLKLSELHVGLGWILCEDYLATVLSVTLTLLFSKLSVLLLYIFYFAIAVISINSMC